MKKILRRIGLSIFILGGVALFVGLNHYNLIKVERAVCHAEVTTLEVPVNEYVRDYLGSSMLDYPVRKYADLLMYTFPQIERASVTRSPWGEIDFDYSSKKAIVLINLDMVYGLTARGELVPANGENLPIITGLNIPAHTLYKPLNEKYIGYALKIANLINSDTTGIGRKVSVINLGHPSGLSIYLEGCKSELVLGRGEEIFKLRKLVRFEEFFCALDDFVESVDFRFDNQLILKKSRMK